MDPETEVLEQELEPTEEIVEEPTEEQPVEESPLPSYVTQEDYDKLRRELEEVKNSRVQPQAPIVQPEYKGIADIVAEEVAAKEARGEYVSDVWVRGRELELTREQTKQEMFSMLAPLLTPLAQKTFVEEALGDAPQAVSAAMQAVRDGKVTVQELSNPFVADAVKRAYGEPQAQRPPLQKAAPTGVPQAVGGLRGKLSPELKQDLAFWEEKLGMKFTDEQIKESYQLG